MESLRPLPRGFPFGVGESGQPIQVHFIRKNGTQVKSLQPLLKGLSPGGVRKPSKDTLASVLGNNSEAHQMLGESRSGLLGGSAVSMMEVDQLVC